MKPSIELACFLSSNNGSSNGNSTMMGLQQNQICPNEIIYHNEPLYFIWSNIIYIFFFNRLQKCIVINLKSIHYLRKTIKKQLFDDEITRLGDNPSWKARIQNRSNIVFSGRKSILTKRTACFLPFKGPGCFTASRRLIFKVSHAMQIEISCVTLGLDDHLTNRITR